MCYYNFPERLFKGDISFLSDNSPKLYKAYHFAHRFLNRLILWLFFLWLWEITEMNTFRWVRIFLAILEILVDMLHKKGSEGRHHLAYGHQNIVQSGQPHLAILLIGFTL